MSSWGTDGPLREKLSVLFGDCVVPEDFRRVLADARSITLEVDEVSAPYPWEMLAQSSYSRTSFIGTEVPVARQFRTERAPVASSPPALNNSLRILVVADPAASDFPLPKARDEARAVIEIIDRAHQAWNRLYDIKVTVRMGSPGDERIEGYLRELAKRTDLVESATTCDPVDIILQIVRGNFDVIHYAGHGFFEPKSGRSGWILSKDCRLTANEIFRVRQVPRLVFANACFSTVIREKDHNAYRAGLASVAYAFFTRGIPNFIGAGWPVGDTSAEDCARRFYAEALGLSQPVADDKLATAPPATIGYALLEARRMLKTTPSLPAGALTSITVERATNCCLSTTWLPRSLRQPASRPTTSHALAEPGGRPLAFGCNANSQENHTWPSPHPISCTSTA